MLSQTPVSWRYTVQSIVALFTMKAECMELTKAIKKAIWLQGLLDDWGIEHDFLKIYCDR